jgi:hypothetical protein
MVPANVSEGSVRAALALLIGAGLALALGLWTAYLAVQSPNPIGAITLGAWQAWPNAGTTAVDPYSRARLARTGEIPLGSGEGLTLLARTDDSGATLRSRCDYSIAGQTPPARLWTISVEEPDGEVIRDDDSFAALGSNVLLREPDGAFNILVSATPKPGNWVSTGAAQEFRLVVRLYDTTARVVTALTSLTMPRIIRERCA